MGISWDFTNYTFSFLVSLIGTILGVCYPLFLENIRKIDDQYQSTVLSKRFQNAVVFKMYRVLLMMAIIISFLAPFIMLVSDNVMVNISIETVHCLTVLALVLVMLYMFRVIQMYYNPDDLSKNLFDNPNSICLPADKELLMASVDLMRYSCERNNPEVYTRCEGYLLNIAKSEQDIVESEFYNLSLVLQETIKRISDLSTNENLKPLCYDNILAHVYYNVFSKGFNGENNYNTIWWSLNRMMESENTEWFQQYWSAAVSYYSLAIKNQRPPVATSNGPFENQTRFLEFHQMVGAMLVYHHKYDWLRYILTVDQVSPSKFNLIPGSISQIVFYVTRYETQTDRPWILTEKYQMKGICNDINSDFAILQQMYRYFALLVIRLFSYNDYNIGYYYPMEQPDIENYDLNELKELKRITERLLLDIGDYWFVGNRISEIHLPVMPDMDEAKKLLEDLIDKINGKIQFHIENPILDKDKFKELKSLLANCDNNFEPLASSPTDEEREGWMSSGMLLTVHQQLDADMSSEDGYRGWSNFPEVILHILNTKIARYIDGCYSILEPIADLCISEKNLFAALNRLEISSGYIILCMGVYLGGIDMKFNKQPVLSYDKGSCFYGNISVIERNSAYSVIFAMRESDLLKMETLEVEEDDKDFDKMSLLDNSKNCLYTNIDEIIHSGNSKPILKLGKKICVYMKKDAKVVRIRVSSDRDDTVELSRMKTLKEYVVKQD